MAQTAGDHTRSLELRWKLSAAITGASNEQLRRVGRVFTDMEGRRIAVEVMAHQHPSVWESIEWDRPSPRPEIIVLEDDLDEFPSDTLVAKLMLVLG